MREAILNAVTHRDYSDPGEVLVRHTQRELVVTSPGSFLADITPKNILRHEPISRNRTLAEAFQKLRLVERAGIGRRRTLRVYNGSFDKRMAGLIAQWKQQGKEIDLDGLFVISFLRENAFIGTSEASELLQIPRDEARAALDQLTQPRVGVLERRGKAKATTYHLAKGIAKDLLGKAAYTKTRGLNPIRYAEMVRAFIADHGSITPKECRELLGLGESQTARVEVSRYLKKWSAKRDGFLRREGRPPKVRYYPLVSAELE